MTGRAGAHPPTQHRPRPAIKVLALTPTRELATQIAESFRTYGRNVPLRYTVIFGGVGQGPQVQSLRTGVDIVVATPGRLLDLMEQGFVDLRSVQVLILDEADNMLDMGFIHDIRKIVQRLPAQRQNLLFSATMPREILDLAHTILKNPVSVQVAPTSSAAETVNQAVYFLEKKNKPAMLAHFINNNPVGRTLVFTRTKHGADKVAKHLIKSGIRAEAIHGNKSQNHRSRTLASFKSSAPPVLVATDVAARGLDIDEVSHVINYDVPNVPETYVHRIGRTGRAGASGEAVSFCDREERDFIRQIERLMKRSIPVRSDQPVFADAPAGSAADEASREDRPERPGSSGSRRPQRERTATFPPRAPTVAPGRAAFAAGGGVRSTHGPASSHPPRPMHRPSAPASEGQEKPSYGNAKHNTGHGKSSYGGSSGGKPHFGGGKPSFGGGKPAFKGGKPSFGTGKPAFGGGKPAFASGKPAAAPPKPASAPAHAAQGAQRPASAPRHPSPRPHPLGARAGARPSRPR